MKSRPAGEVINLPAARETRSDDDGIVFGFAEGWKQALFTDGARNVIMLCFVTERTGHSAAARVQLNDFRSGDSTQQMHGPLYAGQRALVAMDLDDDSSWSGSKFDLGR